MTLRKLYFLGCLLVCQFVLAQNDSIIKLKEIIIPDILLRKFSNSQSILKFNDSVFKKNQPSLSSLLNYNSFIYFKENGFGMVASPSFRGTTAQQTAVIWNGININSQLNGQTDFNTISTRNFNTIEVKSGGGSVIYGSSAIGGSVHLNNFVAFKKQFLNDFQISYGSFNTLDFNYNVKMGTDKFTTEISFSRFSSNNDYPYLGTSLKNENGNFQNSSFNLNFGFKVNRKNTIHFYGQIFDGKRNFSGTLASVSNSLYEDFNTRNLLEWTGFYNRFISKLKFAYFTEKYNYFEDKNFNGFSSGNAKTIVFKHDLNFRLNQKIEFNSVVDFTQNNAFGNDFGNNTRQILAFVLLMKHQVLEKLQYELSFRNEFTNNYKSPFLFAFGTKYEFSKQYVIKVNLSKNFRIPTFNDLYWNGLGNPNLIPEESFQYEVGQELKFNDFTFSATAFLIDINNMIQWSPQNSGVWRPFNIRNVTSKGLEIASNWILRSKNTTFNINCTYARTISTDNQLQTRLIYVPLNKITSSLSFNYKKITTDLQFLYNGKVFTSSDNLSELKSFKIINFGVNYNFSNSNTYKIGFQVRNIFNENYQNVISRPMPGRNFNLNFNLNF